MSNQRLELDLDKLENRGITRYKAVLMASQDARFLNDQIRLGIIDSKEKPTTMAINRLYEGRLVDTSDEELTN